METLGRNLAWAEPGKLTRLGLYRDSRGRIRRREDGAYVCGVSGRVHFKKLYNVPDYDPETEEWSTVWVDDIEAREAGVHFASSFFGEFGKLLREVVR